MTTQNVTLEQLAEKMGYTVWSKGDLKRIYLNDEGWNTKKMSTKTFIFEKDSEFIVSCHIDCPSQPYQWINSQEQEVKDSVYRRIERITNEIAAEFIYAVKKGDEYYDAEGRDILLWQYDYCSKIYSKELAEKIAKENDAEVIEYKKDVFNEMVNESYSAANGN